MKKNHKDRMYKCDDCGRLFMTKNILIRHVAGYLNQALTGSQISCEHCQENDIPREGLHKHMKKSHCDMMFQCGACGKHFVIAKSFNNHMKSAHRGTRFQCDECPKNFATKAVLRVHVKNSHNVCMSTESIIIQM